MTASTYPEWIYDGSAIPDPLRLGERAVRFIRALKHPKTGRYFRLDPWQERIVRRIYGPRHDDGTRIVRQCVMMVPRGARKTTLGAALALLHTIGPERVAGGQVNCCAYDRAQARIAFEEAAGIVRSRPETLQASKILDSRHMLSHRKDRTTFSALSSDGAAANGKTPDFVLFDEIHAWGKRDLFDVMTTGLRKTPGTLSVVISQAGRGEENLAREVFDYARKVASGAVDDPSTLPVLFETPADADWQDEAVWHRANPGLVHGYPDLPSLRVGATQAAERPAVREKFRNDQLNVWLDSSLSPFVEMAEYDRGSAPLDLDTLAGRPCWVGVDMSSVGDLTAVVAAFKDDDGGFTVLPRFFVPADNLRAKADRDGVPYPQWADDGFITATPGNVIDTRAVEAYCRELADTYQVQEFGFDRAYAAPVMGPLNDDRLPVVIIQQGWVTQSPALNVLEAAIISGKFRHGGNPVLRWCFGNVAIHTDTADNRLMHKGKSTDRIDGAAATWMAVSRAAVGETTGSIFARADFNPADVWIDW